MAYQANATAVDFKRTLEQFQHVNAQAKEIQRSFSRMGINDLGSYIEDVLRQNKREQNEKAMRRYIIKGTACPNCGK